MVKSGLSSLGMILILCLTIVPPPAQGADKQDVFIFYSSSQKESVEQAKNLLERLPDSIKTQDLNIDPFSLGGDEARAKVTRQVKESDHVVLVNANPVKVFAGQSFENHLIVMHSTNRSFSFGDHSLTNVVPSGTTIDEEYTVQKIDALSQLQDPNPFPDADFLEVSEGGDLTVGSAVAQLLRSRINP